MGKNINRQGNTSCQSAQRRCQTSVGTKEMEIKTEVGNNFKLHNSKRM